MEQMLDGKKKGSKSLPRSVIIRHADFYALFLCYSYPAQTHQLLNYSQEIYHEDFNLERLFYTPMDVSFRVIYT